MTRADWFSRQCGGGWRTAHRPHTCDRVTSYGLRCGCLIDKGTKYFDTNQHNTRSRCQWATIRICVVCAQQEIQP